MRDESARAAPSWICSENRGAQIADGEKSDNAVYAFSMFYIFVVVARTRPPNTGGNRPIFTAEPARVLLRATP